MNNQNYNYNNNFSLSPEMNSINKKQDFASSLSRYPAQNNYKTCDMSTRYSAINPINSQANQSIFLDEEQVEQIITTTTVQQQNPTKRLHSQSYYCPSSNSNDLVNQLKKSNMFIHQITMDLKNLTDSMGKQSMGVNSDTRKSQYSCMNSSISPISNNASHTDFAFSSPTYNSRTARSYTNHPATYPTEFATIVSQNLNLPTLATQYIPNKPTFKETNPLRVSSYHNGNQTVINFPFSVSDKDGEQIDTRANYRSTQQEATETKEEIKSRTFHIQHEDLEYQEIEDFTNPSKNIKQIKYPYQLNWKRVEKAPEFIENIINAQKNRSESNETSPIQQQQQEAVKYPGYIPKSSFNLADETGYKSYVDTTANMSNSYLTSMNSIPIQYY